MPWKATAVSNPDVFLSHAVKWLFSQLLCQLLPVNIVAPNCDWNMLCPWFCFLYFLVWLENSSDKTTRFLTKLFLLSAVSFLGQGWMVLWATSSPTYTHWKHCKSLQLGCFIAFPFCALYWLPMSLLAGIWATTTFVAQFLTSCHQISHICTCPT
jgi:hypothetical protein